MALWGLRSYEDPLKVLKQFVVLVEIIPEWCGVQMQRLFFSLIPSESAIFLV
jgi:hypothetical protein